ncbi:hypothetical protein DDB_G0289113 [Dictyostelium discoideum AX4]|uniref:EGF-like domain-containing protein n=1 Tax=Dictyostelium discoideum TaxID=44689 RepID=Q54HZ6_DICDI|nr:hypothetical protein DDB_G0289113 [Dictyostelium discoideum AX4]EAL62906.1 hypothetical protein DDB_G0289113 [Dictyostelium discoideum AX4]|eukprot:XP_636409.1 hypothetical protein DDB_G0289113 [Dictyostelium discoideum AX4]
MGGSNQIIFKSLLILIFLLFTLDPIFTATTDEITCLNNFISKFNISTVYNNYCSSLGFRCLNGNGVVQKISLFANPFTTNGEYVVPTDLTCLPSLEEIYLYNFKVSSDLLYYKFSTVYTYNYTNIKTIDNSLTNGFTQLLPSSSQSYGYYQISSDELKSFTLKLSYLANVQQFTLGSGSRVYIDCDSAYNTSKLVVLNVEGAINYPNVTNLLKFQTQTYTFTEEFLESSISNFTTAPKYGSVTAIHPLNKIYPYYGNLNRNIYTFTSTARYSAPSSIIDLSGFSFFYLTLNNVGPDFNVNGKFPFSINSNRYTDVKVYGGNYTVFPDIVSTINSDLSIKNNGLSMELPKFKGVTKYPIDLSNNNLYGTIDKSWCKVSLNVANNSLSGEIPSCYACYLNVADVYNKFIGNSFTNLISNYQCTTFKPNISRVYYSTNTLKITGVDIGHDPKNYVYNGATPDSWGTSIPGFEYTITYNSADFSKLSYFNLQFKNPIPAVTYTFPSIPQAPTPTSVKVINDQLTIPGTFFSSYMGNLIQTVLVAGIDCTVTSVNFYSLTCTAVSPLPTTEDIQFLKIQTGNLTRRAYIKTVNESLNNVLCTNCNGNDQACDMSSGTCYASCPNDCSGFGTCNNQTGVCTCDANRQALDCSLPYFECPADTCGTIIKNSFCNNQTGECKCDSTHQGSDCLTPYIECNFSCGFGTCNNQTGLCVCDSTHQGYYCNNPLIPCLNNCSGQYCDTYQGICYCDYDHQGEDCSKDFKECPVFNDYYCNDKGECDFETGICSCFSNSSFTGPACSIADHYISSVIPSFEEGGDAIFNGWFGDEHINLTLTIGDKQCTPILSNSSTSITCKAKPGSGIKNVILFQNDLTYTANNIYLYKTQNKTLQCPNQCSNKGTCNSTTGECKCYKGYGSFDCSTLSNGDKDLGESNTGGNGGNGSNPPNESVIDPNKGGANVTNQEVNFQIYFESLLEIDFNGNTVYEYSLQRNWELEIKNQTLNENKYVFKKTIQESCLIISTVEEINENKNLEFAGETFIIESGSIKFTISINNYQYKSSLNTLKLNFISSVNQLSNENNNENDCNEKQTSISTNDNLSNFNYIKISKNNKVLSGRFVNRLVSDGKSTFLSTTTTKLSDSVIVSLSLPHCTKECIIDPDFSVLLEPDFKSECETDSDKRNWVIPVAVVLPVAGAAALATIGGVIYKKKYIENPLKKKLQGIANRNS